VVRESKPFMDSLDRKQNKPAWGDLLFGYTWENSWKRKSITLASPINTVQYNLVQGLKLNIGLSYRKFFDKKRNKMLVTGGRLNYGIAEQKLRAAGDFTWRFDPKKFAQVRVSGGREVMQFNELEPISTLYNTFFTLVNRQNYARFYDKKWFFVISCG
jgi:hypothetical protein